MQTSAEATHDGVLVDRLKAGDADAYETLVRDHIGRMLAVARRYLRSDEDAQDVVQEAFLAVFRGIDGFAGHARLSTWMHRIVVNAALMRIRKRSYTAEKPIDDLLPTFLDDGHHAIEPQAWNVDAAQAIESAETRELVRDAIDQLPDGHRTVLLLRDIDGFDTGETAAALGISENAAKIRLHRARQALRQILDPHFSEEQS